MAGRAPAVAISSQGLECCWINVALPQESFEVILGALLLTASRSPTNRYKLVIEDLPARGGGEAYGLHARPCISARCVGLAIDVDVGHPVFPGHAQDPTQTTAVKVLESTHTPLIGGPGFRFIQSCIEAGCPTHSCFGASGKVPVLKDSRAELTKGNGGQAHVGLYVTVNVAGG